MKTYIFVAVLLSIAMAIPAQANYSCQGTVTFLGVNQNAGVVVGGPGGLPDVYLCQLNTTSPNGWLPEDCKAAYAILLSAKLSGQTVTIYFNDSLMCSTQPAWANYVSSYFVSTP